MRWLAYFACDEKKSQLSEFRILMSPEAQPFDDDGIASFTSASKAATQNGNNILGCMYLQWSLYPIGSKKSASAKF